MHFIVELEEILEVCFTVVNNCLFSKSVLSLTMMNLNMSVTCVGVTVKNTSMILCCENVKRLCSFTILVNLGQIFFV